MCLSELKFLRLLTNLSDEQSATPPVALQNCDKTVDESSSKPVARTRRSGKWARMLDPSTWNFSDHEQESDNHEKNGSPAVSSSIPPSLLIKVPSFTPPPSRSVSGKLCGKYQQPLSGQFVRALGYVHHLDCFTCMVSSIRQRSSTYNRLPFTLGLRHNCGY